MPDVELADSSVAIATGRPKASAVVALARPYQWLKNGLVLAALVFGQRLFDLHAVVHAGIAFIAFCAISSTGYIINDIGDRATDRMHPEKRGRPLASGELGVGEATAIGSLLGMAGLSLSALLGPALLAIVTGYLAMQFFYSHYAKHVVIVDIVVIAVGFVLRAYAGGLAINVVVSPWLIFITFVLALFLSLARRRHELIVLGEAATGHRGTLGEYSIKSIDQMLAMVAGATLVGYMIYTASPEVAEKLHTQHLFLTVPFVAFGILRYLFLVNACDEGGDPARLVLRDRPLLISIILWVIADVLLLYF